jgi:hypothetical protein
VPPELTIDTTVLVRGNVELTPERAAATRQAARVGLLRRVNGGKAAVLISPQLVAEYARQVPEPRNEFVRLFLELITKPDGSYVVSNWRKPWTHSDRARMHECRFPSEDDHVLRTAVRDQRTTIYSEEERMLRAHPCIRRRFDVVISAP